jgi:AcrR family transcriptional regulator
MATRAELAEHGHAHVSLRAVARRAGVSHAAPKYHFEDRAGLLTAVATEGFDALTVALEAALEAGEGWPVAALGKAYIDFGLANPALFDLMFRPSELHPDDPLLVAAQAGALGALASAVHDISGPPASPDDVAELALTSWALVHGLVVLVRDGALRAAAGAPGPAAGAELAHRLADVFTDLVVASVAAGSHPPASSPG